MLTLEEIKEKLKDIEETLLIEVLEINSTMIVDRFEDIIEDRINILYDRIREL
jgi:hypothetical protein